jgi:hypothetical protein
VADGVSVGEWLYVAVEVAGVSSEWSLRCDESAQAGDCGDPERGWRIRSMRKQMSNTGQDCIRRP